MAHKCPKCGGSLILERGTKPSEDRIKCIAGDWSISRQEAEEMKKNSAPKEEAMEEKKICSKCHQEKTLDQFSKNQATKDGFESWCKSCKAKAQADYRTKKIKKAAEDNPPFQKSRGNGRRRHIPEAPLIKASPDEIMKALRIGIRKETADEIFNQLSQNLAQLRERFV